MVLLLVYVEGNERGSHGGVSGPGGLVIINGVPGGPAVRVRATPAERGDEMSDFWSKS